MAPPIRSVKLTVVENATQKNVTGTNNWAAVKMSSGHVIVEATTAPKNNNEEWKQIQWSGDSGESVPGRANRRKLPLAVSKKYHLQATLGDAKEYVDLWILWATVEILTKGTRPSNSAPFDKGMRDNTDTLGAVTYESLTSSVIDEKAGVFARNMGASGKVAPVATLLPTGVFQTVKSGWTFERQLNCRDWLDGQVAKKTTKTWATDTSAPQYLRLTPDKSDKIYDLDGPDLRWGNRSYETYNNFRQWIEWNGEKCSDLALWYWQARWNLHKESSKQITLNDLGVGKNIDLPTKPHFPAGKAR